VRSIDDIEEIFDLPVIGRQGHGRKKRIPGQEVRR
jgi:hypothetical protein